MFSFEVAMTLGGIIGLIATIFVYIKYMPKRLDGNLEKPWQQFLHDFFHFKKLYLEEVLKFVYVLATIVTICAGILLLVSYQESYSYSYYSGYKTVKESTFLYGLAMIVGGPIGLRLGYEVIMMFILLVKNTIEINNKLSGKQDEEQQENAPAAPRYDSDEQ